MGTADLMVAFNSIADPRFTCSRALLSYEQAHDVEWQVLTFSGTGSDGAVFTIKSERLRPHTDVLAAARLTAQKLLDQQAKP